MLKPSSRLSGLTMALMLSTTTFCSAYGQVVPNVQLSPQAIEQQAQRQRLLAATNQARPVISSFRINAGAAITGNRVVVLDITLGANASRVTEMRVSESPDFAGSPWTPLQLRPNANLSIGNGDKPLYLQVRAPAAKTTALNGGFDTSEVATATILFANPRLIGAALENRRTFTHTPEVSVKVDYEGNANLYRVSERADFAGAEWKTLPSGRTFRHTLSPAPGRKDVYVQVANGSDYISDRKKLSIDLVKTKVFEPRLDDVFAEARAEGFLFSATSEFNNWTCEFFTFTDSGFVEMRATPKMNIAGIGFAGSDTCTFKVFGGKKLAAPWTIHDVKYVPVTVPLSDTVFVDRIGEAGGDDLSMTVQWRVPESGAGPALMLKGGWLVPFQLSGPENGDWRDAFE